MKSNLPFQVTVCGIGELAEHRRGNVSHVLSILDPGFPVPEDFASFGPHRRLELRFHDIIDDIPGMQRPEPEHIRRLLDFAQETLVEATDDAHLLLHCHAGVSRSSASAILVLAKACPQMPADEITAWLLHVRENVWPNLRMLEIGDALLGRRGKITGAVRQLYRTRLERNAELANLMRHGGRGREVDLATSDGRQA